MSTGTEHSAAELSSLSTALEDITKRLVAIADGYSGSRREELATELYGAERQLHSAIRRIGKVMGSTR
ncbi:MAG: hypothetical protein ACYDH5_18270 [Acidimicrobiales bacterium]